MSVYNFHCSIAVSHAYWTNIESKSRLPISEFSGFHCLNIVPLSSSFILDSFFVFPQPSFYLTFSLCSPHSELTSRAFGFLNLISMHFGL